MRLNLQTDYALRLLMQLAVAPDGFATVADVAARFGISRNHLTKVAATLAREGIIDSVRGRGGGLRLARPATDINVGAVVRLIENDFALVDCFPGGNGGCVIVPACRLKSVLHEAADAFCAALDRYSLADLTAGNRGLEALLGKEAA